MKNAVNWFEIPATDLERAAKFYSEILSSELKMEKFAEAMMAIFPYEQGSGVGGALIAQASQKPSLDGAIVYLNAGGDVADVLDRVEAAGGEIIMPKTSIGPMGWIAYIKDSEGNRVGLHSYLNGPA